MKNIIHITFLLTISLLGCINPSNKKDLTNQTIPVENLTIKNRQPLLLSNDFGKTWTNASEDLPAAMQVSFIERMDNELVIATDNMALFISHNNRTQWKQIGTDLPNEKINALHISKEAIFAGVYRTGIFKSTDKGTTWLELNHDLANLNVQAILELDDELFIGTDAGIFKFQKDKKSWQQLGVTEQILSIYDYDGKLVAGTSQGTLLSTDKGKSWNWIRKEGAVHYTHNVGARIVELGLNGDLFFSDDWGSNWTASTYQPRHWSYIYELIKTGDYYVMSNNYGIHRSKDNGVNWEHIFKTESMGFFDLLEFDGVIYGGTRVWDEYRKRE